MKFLKLTVSILVCEAAGIIGSFFTTPEIPNWYATLEKPAFSPPNWIFAPVWIFLYLLMGLSLYFAWTANGTHGKTKKIGLAFFCIQLALNSIWSIIFFGFKNPFYAFIELVFLLIILVLTICGFWKIKKTAAILLLPYLAWGIFAAVLNYAIWQLNV